MRYRARTELGRRAVDRIGRRGTLLLILFVADVGIGFSFLDPTDALAQSESYIWRSQWAPSYAWGLLWILVGAICAASAFFRHDRAGWIAAVGLKLLWGSMELTGWLAGAIDLGYRPALIWFAFAIFIHVVSGLPERPHPSQTPAEGTTP